MDNFVKQSKYREFNDKAVEMVFQAYPSEIKEKLLNLRELIFYVAEKTDGVGDLTEVLKWGQPSYLTLASKSGSTIRIDCLKTKQGSKTNRYGLFFHCQTNLVETFKILFPSQLNYDGNRCIFFDVHDEIPTKELSYCIELGLTYHLNKRSRINT